MYGGAAVAAKSKLHAKTKRLAVENLEMLKPLRRVLQQ